MFATESLGKAYVPNLDFKNPTDADGLCNGDAAAAGHSGNYRAVIVDGINRIACTSANCSGTGAQQHVDWVLQASTAYYRSDRTTLVHTTNENGIFTSDFANAVDDGPFSYWTGLDSSGGWNWVTAPENCAQWSTENGGVFGRIGSSFATGAGSMGSAAPGATCDGAAPQGLLCVEQ